jgi:hypothetical protein
MIYGTRFVLISYLGKKAQHLESHSVILAGGVTEMRRMFQPSYNESTDIYVTYMVFRH